MHGIRWTDGLHGRSLGKAVSFKLYSKSPAYAVRIGHDSQGVRLGRQIGKARSVHDVQPLHTIYSVSYTHLTLPTILLV